MGHVVTVYGRLMPGGINANHRVGTVVVNVPGINGSALVGALTKHTITEANSRPTIAGSRRLVGLSSSVVLCSAPNVL